MLSALFEFLVEGVFEWWWWRRVEHPPLKGDRRDEPLRVLPRERPDSN